MSVVDEADAGERRKMSRKLLIRFFSSNAAAHGVRVERENECESKFRQIAG